MDLDLTTNHWRHGWELVHDWQMELRLVLPLDWIG
jgi:hypothetical protein